MIAVVDDDPSVCRALKRLLRSLSHEVETFSSARDFLDWHPEGNLDCLILDVHMPDMTGFELKRKLSEDGRNPPIIFITAHDDLQTRQCALNSNVVAYLRKPFDDQSLIDAIQKAAGGTT
jgi:FixJ family two-component response regulator